MPITINQDMVDTIKGEDLPVGISPWEDSVISFSIDVDPGNLLQEVVEAAGIGGHFDPDRATVSATDRTGITLIAGLWDDLIARSLVYLAGDEDADITVEQVTNMPSTNSGFTYSTLVFPVLPNDADVFLRSDRPVTAGMQGWATAMHEFGHALGIQHPGSYDASDGEPVTYENSRTYDEDTGRYSIMSYFEPDADGTVAAWLQQQTLTPMIYDILAIQQIYGVDTTTRTGNTTYGFNGNADRAIYNFTPAGVGTFVPVMTIWDAGGIDRLDFSGYSIGMRIDLAPGSYSDVGHNTLSGGAIGNFGIAFSTWIEEAIGGTGDDRITGNELDNLLDGGANADTLRGLDGHDTLIGGAGEDSLDGGSGHDSLDGGSENDILDGGTGDDTLVGGAGNDSLYGWRDVDTLDGGEGDDVIDGGGSGSGGPGAAFPDMLTGGAGTDTFIYQRAYKATVITDFNTRPGEDDIIDMRSTFANVFSFTELLANGQQIGSDVVFNFGAGDPLAPYDKLTLNGKTLDSLDPSQFQFSEDPNSPSAAFQIVPNPDIFRQVSTEAAALVDGGFVTATVTINTYWNQTIFGNRFDHRGVNVGSFAINSTPLNFGNSHSQVPQIATLSDGRIVAAWKSEDTGVTVIRARLFSPDLVPLGADFVVNTIPIIDNGYYTGVEEIRVLPGGGFAVIWETDTDPGSNLSIVLRERAYDAAGAPTTNDLTLGPPAPATEFFVEILLGDGRVLHYWQETLSLSGPPYSAPGPIWAQITGDPPVQVASGTTWINGMVHELEDGRIQFVFQGGGSGTGTVILDSDLNGFTRPGTANADTLKGGIYNDQLYGVGGNDTLIGGRGPDILDGGAGVDIADYDASLLSVYVDMSDAAPESGGHANGDMLTDVENIRGSGYADTIIGDFRDNRLDGSYGNDIINGGLGNDVIFGGKGNDTLDGGGGLDTVVGGAGVDDITIRGSNGAVGYGGDANDTFHVLGNGLTAYGEYGEDKFFVDGDNNTILVGPWDVTDDLASVTGSGNTIIGNSGGNLFGINGGAGNVLSGGSGDDTLSNWGDGDLNQLYGGDGQDEIRAADGNDLIWTDEGAGWSPSRGDIVDAGGGDDVVNSTGDADVLNGGEGTDTLVLYLHWRNNAVSVTFDGPGGVAGVVDDGTTITGFENISLILSAFDDTVTASGPDGNFAGSLTLSGADGADTLTAGDGADFLTGGTGDDLLTGGAGADTFTWASGDGTDTITDFVVGEDKIDLTGVAGEHELSDLSIAQVGDDTVITLGSGIVLKNVEKSTLTDSDFVFAPDPGGPPDVPATNYVVTNEDTASTQVLIDPNFDEGSTLTFALKPGFGPSKGSVGFSNGRFVYTPTPNANGADAFTILVDNGFGGVAEQVVTVAVTPVADAAVIGGTLAGAVTEDGALTATGNLTIVDPDAGQAAFQPGTINGAHGTLVVTTAGKWTYTLNNTQAAVQALNAGQSLPDTIAVKAFDGTTKSVTITIRGVNEAPAPILGNNNANTLSGTAGADVIDARGGNDVVNAGAGNDKVNGGLGSDTIRGGAGKDTLYGDAGSDVLVGGLGNDTMYGGAGNDTFAYAAADSTIAQPDTIRDFDDGSNDRIDLSAIFGGKLIWRGSGALNGVHQVHIKDVAGPDVLVEVNLGGTLAPEMVIRLAATTVASMTASDFVL